MSEPFIAEIRIFAGNFAPRSWAFCNGQLLPVSQNTALFSLIGTTYGGDGRTTTALPDLQGRAPMHAGRGPGLTSRRLGQRGGAETVTLSTAQIPGSAHGHGLDAADRDGTDTEPEGNLLAIAVDRDDPTTEVPAYSSNAERRPMATGAVAPTTFGGGQAHNNMQPFMAINFIIALQGLYPSRS